MRYRALIGLDVPIDEAETARIVAAREAGHPLEAEGREMARFEPGDIVDYIPEQSAVWMLQQGAVEEYDGRRPKVSNGKLVWSDDGEVYHDRGRVTEKCNTDDMVEPRYANVPPEGRELCSHCRDNPFVEAAT